MSGPGMHPVWETVLGGASVIAALGIASYGTHVMVGRQRLVATLAALHRKHTTTLQKTHHKLQSVLVECPDGGYFIGAKQNLGLP